MKSQSTENQIFVDVSGRRWKTIRLILLLLLLVISGFVFLYTPRILAEDSFPAYYDGSQTVKSSRPSQFSEPDVSELAERLSGTDISVVGNGTLVRLMRVIISDNGNKELRDAFTGDVIAKASAEDMAWMNPGQFVFLRYGASGEGRRLILTFDDGPTAAYTPQLLDLLSEHSIKATFFVNGSNVVKNPDIFRRLVNEGHIAGNHSFSHANLETLPSFWAQQEINLTQRVMREASGYETEYFRPPYVGSSDQAIRNSLKGIIEAQKLGYVISLYDYDTNDWQAAAGGAAKPAMPKFDGKDHVILLHDGGGDRSSTLSYVKTLIEEAGKNNYTFAGIDVLGGKKPPNFSPEPPSTSDEVAMIASRAVLVWPSKIIMASFSITVVLVLLGMLVYFLLAWLQLRREARQTPVKLKHYHPNVNVIIPAYNEAKVLETCVKSILASDYQRLTVCIVDDGSTDSTWKIASRLSKKHLNVMAVRQGNSGKATAINTGISLTNGAIVIGIDADTLFESDTVSRLVPHFANPKIGAVAGVVKVGNLTNMLTRFQALEYITSISLERNAQAFIDSIMVVPGACGAWRRKAILAAGGYSADTLAEDCDLTFRVHALGYKIIQDNRAVAYTEAPTDLRSFIKQRFRWTFGNLQVYWKQRNTLFSGKHLWLDSFTLPNALIAILTPLIFLPLLAVVTTESLLQGNYVTLVIFAAVLLLMQLLRAFIGLLLARERLWYLLLVPFARIIYGPLRVYLLYSTAIGAVRGMSFGWNKLDRSGVQNRIQVSVAGRPAVSDTARAFQVDH